MGSFKLRAVIVAISLIVSGLLNAEVAQAQNELRQKIEELADKLTSSTAGEIAGIDGQIVYISLGEKDGISEGSDFEVVQLGEVMMVGNKAIHKETPAGEIQVTKVRKEMSLAKITGSYAPIKAGQKIYQKKQKTKRIALTEFAYGNSLNNLTRNIYESLAVSFAQKGLQVVERSQLEKILNEQKISQSGMIDISTAQKLGQLLSTEAVLLGSVMDTGGGIAIRARWVDATKGVVITAAEVDVTKTSQLLAMLGANLRENSSATTVEPLPEEPGAALSPSPPGQRSTNQFMAGVYTDNGQEPFICTIATSNLKGGRTEVAISCKKNAHILSASWATGAITGHPFELDLKAAGIDKIPGNDSYAWGKVSFTTNNWSTWECFRTSHIISARQVGETIALSCYEKANQQKCGITLVLSKDEKPKGK